jgi:multidrug efflux system membrane fusion protein
MRITSVILALAVAAALAYWFGLRHEGGLEALMAGGERGGAAETAAPAPPAVAEAGARAEGPVPVMVMESRAEDTVRRLTLRGHTEANRLVEVTAETEGRVISEPLRRGARVAKGDLLCRLDPGNRPARLAEAEARLARARADAEAAERLAGQGFTAETTRKARQYDFEAARAALDAIRLDIERLEIRAPFAGVLESDTAEIGSRLGLGAPCATVVDLSRVKAVAAVSETAVEALSPGRPARVRLVTGLERTGEIAFIGRVADPDTRTYEIEVALDNADGRLRAGMTAEIAIELPPERGHRLPQSALTLDDEGRLGVRLAAQGRARFAPVEILRDSRHGVWVAGLPETARVIVVGQEFVRDGRAIEARPVGWDELG